jgi:putative transposase
MPAINQQRNFQPNSYYHIYNRAANGSDLFQDKNDYWVFRKIARQELEKQNISQEDIQISIDTFCCLPTHYHFLFFQRESEFMTRFMKSIGIRYSLYFNKKYRRTGRLFESHYKAIHLPTPADAERIRKYIMDNPINKGYLTWKHRGRKI